jgi:hypothetical protein
MQDGGDGYVNEAKIIWTAAAIGQTIGRSPDYVRRTLARLPGSPVQRIGRGNFYAVEAELLSFWHRLMKDAA